MWKVVTLVVRKENVVAEIDAKDVEVKVASVAQEEEGGGSKTRESSSGASSYKTTLATVKKKK